MKPFESDRAFRTCVESVGNFIPSAKADNAASAAVDDSVLLAVVAVEVKKLLELSDPQAVAVAANLWHTGANSRRPSIRIRCSPSGS